LINAMRKHWHLDQSINDAEKQIPNK